MDKYFRYIPLNPWPLMTINGLKLQKIIKLILNDSSFSCFLILQYFLKIVSVFTAEWLHDYTITSLSIQNTSTLCALQLSAINGDMTFLKLISIFCFLEFSRLYKIRRQRIQDRRKYSIFIYSYFFDQVI